MKREHSLFYFQLRGSLLSLLIAIATIGGVIYYYAEKALVETVQQNLKYHANFRIQRINTHLQEQKEWMSWATDTGGLLEESERVLDIYRKTGGDSAGYGMYRDHLRMKYRKMISAEKVKDLLLLNGEGELIFSLRPIPTEIGEDMSKDGFYGDTILSELIGKVITTQKFAISRYGRVEQIHGSAVLMGAPLFSSFPGQEEEVVGILVRPFSLEKLRGLLEDYSGLGGSGDVLIGQWRAGEDGTAQGGVNFVNHFRHRASRSPDQACIKRRGSNQEEFAMAQAMSGASGFGWSNDFSCEKVYGVWSWVPELEWGVVVVQDRVEIMAPIKNLQLNIILTSLLMLLFLFWMVSRQARILSNPLVELANEAEQSRVIDERGFGRVKEVNKLATTLKHTFSVLAEQQDTLEQKVEERTRELSDTNSELVEQRKELVTKSKMVEVERDRSQSIFAAAQEGMIVVNQRGRIMDINPKMLSILGYSSADEVLWRRVGSLVISSDDGFKSSLLNQMNKNLQQLHDRDHIKFHKAMEEAPLPLLVVNLEPNDHSISLFIVNEEMERTLGYSSGELHLDYTSTKIALSTLLTGCCVESFSEQVWSTKDGGSLCLSAELEGEIGSLFATKAEGIIEGTVCITPIKCGNEQHAIIILKGKDSMDESLLRLTPFGRMFLSNHSDSTNDSTEDSITDNLSVERNLRATDGEEIPVEIAGALFKSTIDDDDSSIEGGVLMVRDLREQQELELVAQEAAYQGGMAEISSHVLHNFGNALTSVKFYLESLSTLDQFLAKMEQLLSADEAQYSNKQLASAIGEAHKKYTDKPLKDMRTTIDHMSEILVAQKGMIGDGGGYWVSNFNLQEAMERADRKSVV